MCGRFSLTKEEAILENRFSAKFYSNNLVKRYNVAPGQLALVMTDEKPLEMQFYMWGLIPSWTKNRNTATKMINAKAETLFEKPSFKNLIRKKRCLVLSDGFYEWQDLGNKNKQPYRIGLLNEELFAMGGLWDSWIDMSTGVIENTFCIITTAANNKIKAVHDRMPLILEREAENIWLNKNSEISEIQALLKPLPEELMKLYPVSKKVNAPINDCEDIILPVTLHPGNGELF